MRPCSSTCRRSPTTPAAKGATLTVPLALPAPLAGRTFTVRIAALREVKQTDYFSGLPLLQPVALAELGLPGVTQAVDATRALPAACRDDLLAVDGHPVSVRVEGTVGQALRREPLPLVACDGPLTLATGDHRITSATGRDERARRRPAGARHRSRGPGHSRGRPRAHRGGPGRHELPAAGRRRDQAVLAGPRPEPQHRLGGHRERAGQPRRAGRGGRLRQRLAGGPRPSRRAAHHRAALGAPTPGVGRAGGLRARRARLPGAGRGVAGSPPGR